ncbi:hypothetical protein RHMOL_Rhmol12G0247800 [Rhododendron molle]|uniref:Uncharacterized protein n=1 Tax=Rhododendron molle TaxID=49168 RepID=A0ACC0LM66_RHOML|nr:hypothetical protein RHMOL_Rhmol12G0247800 [Rhododendron molle]
MSLTPTKITSMVLCSSDYVHHQVYTSWGSCGKGFKKRFFFGLVLAGETSTQRIPYTQLFHDRPLLHLNYNFFSSNAADKAQGGGHTEKEK